MNLADFVSKLMSGSVRVLVGGRDDKGRLVSGFADPSSLTDEQIAAEAFANDVEETSEQEFESVVDMVAKLRTINGTL